LALQQEKDRITKEREDSRRTIAYLQDLLQKKLGGDIDVLLAGIPGVPITDVATQDRVFPYYVPIFYIKYSKSDSKDRSQEIL
jgi:hypothetical protein